MHGGYRDLKKGGANGYLRRGRDHGKGLGDIKAAALLLDIGLDQLGCPGQHGVLAAIPHQQMDHDKGLNVLLVVHGEAAGCRRAAGGPRRISGDPRRKAADLILDLLLRLIAARCDFLFQRCLKLITICFNSTACCSRNFVFEPTYQSCISILTI